MPLLNQIAKAKKQLFKNRLKINNFSAKIFIGIIEKERLERQAILIELKLYFDFTKTRFSNDMFSSICYIQIINLIQEKIVQVKPFLLETLIFYVINILFNFDDRLQFLDITIKKKYVIEKVGFISISFGINKWDFYISDSERDIHFSK